MLKLDDKRPLFVGFKLESRVRRQLEGITGSDRRYVSTQDWTFLTICRLGDSDYVGKVVGDGLSTDRITDIRSNVLSILRRLCPDERFPEHMEVLACDDVGVEERE